MLEEAPSGSTAPCWWSPHGNCRWRNEHNSLFPIDSTPRLLPAAPIASASWSATTAIGEIVILHIGGIIAITDIIRVIHLHKNATRLGSNLEQSLLQIVMLLSTLSTHMNVIPKRHLKRRSEITTPFLRKLKTGKFTVVRRVLGSWDRVHNSKLNRHRFRIAKRLKNAARKTTRNNQLYRFR